MANCQSRCEGQSRSYETLEQFRLHGAGLKKSIALQTAFALRISQLERILPDFPLPSTAALTREATDACFPPPPRPPAGHGSGPLAARSRKPRPPSPAPRSSEERRAPTAPLDRPDLLDSSHQALERIDRKAFSVSIHKLRNDWKCTKDYLPAWPELVSSKRKSVRSIVMSVGPGGRGISRPSIEEAAQ
jgi:hypothetical protein